MNSVKLLGRLGRDPETRNFDNGSVTNFSLATTKSYKGKDGERKEKTEWHNISFWGKQGEIIAKYFKKGDSILVEGEITYRDYEKDGVKRTITEIVGDRFHFLPKSSGTPQNAPAPVDISSAESDDDDLPF